MGIEARGGKYPYAGTITAVARRLTFGVVDVGVHTGQIFLTADSDEEAYGIATRAGERWYPHSEGWERRHVSLVPLAGIDWIDRLDLDSLVPEPVPWPKRSA